ARARAAGSACARPPRTRDSPAPSLRWRLRGPRRQNRNSSARSLLLRLCGFGPAAAAGHGLDFFLREHLLFLRLAAALVALHLFQHLRQVEFHAAPPAASLKSCMCASQVSRISCFSSFSGRSLRRW